MGDNGEGLRLGCCLRPRQCRSRTSIRARTDPRTDAKLVETILPPGSTDNQSIKARREVVARAFSAFSQTRGWNLLIDAVAESGHYAPDSHERYPAPQIQCPRRKRCRLPPAFA